MLNSEKIKVFKIELENRRDKIKENLKVTTQEINGLNSNELKDEADYASISIDRAVDNAILLQQTQELKEIESALNKINENIYGICEMCEEEIDIKRLELKIFAKYCIVCREIIEKEASVSNKRTPLF